MTQSPIFRSIPEQIAVRLRQDILGGVFAPGQPLREQEIAEQFAVSRGPIREAFRQLTEQGLLVLEPNKGVRVASLPSLKLRPLIAELRRTIENFALEAIFEHITPADIARWDGILADMHRACEQSDIAGLIESDLRFHSALIQSHDDDGLMTLWRPVALRMLMQYNRFDNLVDSYDEHRAILEAIRAGDKEAALTALAANIQ